ncbi:uncharacterized protein TRAVEDRAFT_54510 [Trametes versicolor FP-101664 SS1]|uniref:Uncharacterized protein n=1 Tax=Trametes versicolor (strain FP-101664) TaxID=717944 RepID=R7S6F2_TRAVS|nr:uncharacterized protein TRAVEDRAFT_54510 [Trametes versicolor FP-101664 SS1]EIW51471.1 hypothetical protein TRAVEDRAFT_54510 [Trametes versicolor FP-101664 SS1]
MSVLDGHTDASSPAALAAHTRQRPSLAPSTLPEHLATNNAPLDDTITPRTSLLALCRLRWLWDQHRALSFALLDVLDICSPLGHPSMQVRRLPRPDRRPTLPVLGSLPAGSPPAPSTTNTHHTYTHACQAILHALQDVALAPKAVAGRCFTILIWDNVFHSYDTLRLLQDRLQALPAVTSSAQTSTHCDVVRAPI